MLLYRYLSIGVLNKFVTILERKKTNRKINKSKIFVNNLFYDLNDENLNNLLNFK